MLSLQEQSLLFQANELSTLDEVLTWLGSLSFSPDPTKLSRNFWTLLLPKIGHSVTLLCFEHLPDQLWPQLINSLCESLYHKYVYYTEDEFQEEINNNDLVFGALYKKNRAPSILLEDGCTVFSFFSPAVQLPPGTKVWIVEFETFHYKWKTEKLVIASADREDPRRIMSVVAEIFADYIKDYYDQSTISIVKDKEENIGETNCGFTYGGDEILAYDLSKCPKIAIENGIVPRVELVDMMISSFIEDFSPYHDFIEEFDTSEPGEEILSVDFLAFSKLYDNNRFGYIPGLYYRKTHVCISIKKRCIV